MLAGMSKADLRQILAANLLAYRRRSGESQDEFAHRCGLHRTYVGSVERCERNVTLATLELLANATGISVATLLTKDGVK
jgi:transcriptional regulator with XRE-family HTH domain